MVYGAGSVHQYQTLDTSHHPPYSPANQNKLDTQQGDCKILCQQNRLIFGSVWPQFSFASHVAALHTVSQKVISLQMQHAEKRLQPASGHY